MKKLVGLLIIAGILVFAGKLYLENRYERELKNAFIYMSPYADIRFDKIEIGLDGSIAATDIRIRPAKIDDTFEIAKLYFKTSDRFMPIRGFDKFIDGDYPEFVEFSILGVSMDTAFISGLQEEDVMCRDFFNSFNYAAAGISTLEGDFNFNVDFRDLYNSEMVIDQYDQTGSSRAEITFDASKLPQLMVSQDNIPIKDVRVEMSLEEDAAARFLDNCADHFKVEKEAFLSKVVGSPKFSQNSFGYDLGDEFRSALMTFMRGGKAFEMTAKPTDQLKDLSRAQFYKPKDVIRFLNLTVVMDGKEIPLSARLIEAEKKQEEADKNDNKGYVVTSYGKVKNQVGKVVRIQRTNDRSEIVGRLTGVDRGRLAIVRYHKRGPMTLTVGPEDIKKIEVRP